MTSHQTATTMFALALILASAHLLGMLAKRCGQPAVIGEILAGILLGPSLFNGAVAGTLLPLDVRPHLVTLGNLGVALFMFVVGLEFDHRLLRGNRRAAAGVSIGSIVFAFSLGCLLALRLWHDHGVADRLGFVLFMGAAMSITAFPVLARILTDRGIQHTRIGALAMARAAIGDVVAWVLLAAIVTLTSGQRSWQVLLAVPYVLLMLCVVRPLLGRIVMAPARGGRELTLGLLVMLMVLLLLSGGVSEWFGLHFIFGAFFAGVIMPRHGSERLRAQISDRVGTVTWILLPAYFAVAGLNVDLAAVSGDGLGELALILLVAIGGKFVGAYAGARLGGQSGRTATTMGVLMNTRGLTELIILGVGLQLQLLDRELYSLMVVMAVVTTAMTAPLLRWSYPRQLADADLLRLSDEWGEAARTAPSRPVVARSSEK
ncbi:cation:proton antiporter [Micromonospora sp. WMMD882]|uniref:cation:proton antiporter n=1 Tax=Micromonospora sp. WMMD882 TaxID=3015151 RepID=UPI00248D399E|nr:cation:proton antiporter [Micromonospora sp. WMMD882]WBB81245.1 cation:proton antiporter [Micromonospora sp. WMMD882]